MSGLARVLSQTAALGHAVSHGAAVEGTWLADPTPGGGVPNPGGGVAPPGVVADDVLKILQWVAYLASAACVAGILYCSIRMAIAHRRGDDTNVSSLGWVLGACVLIGSASGIVGALI